MTELTPSPGFAAQDSFFSWRPWLWAMLAMAPFLALYGCHFLSSDLFATGFIQVDMPYYLANGREIFDRGNGWMYPNPYDPSPDAPVIYFHWLLWVCGLFVVKLGAEPGTFFMVMHVVMALLFARLTWSLLHLLIPDRSYMRAMYLFVMWAGGLFALTAFVHNIVIGNAPFSDLMRFNPMMGWWFLNWGSNGLYPTEATYHVLMLLVWIGILTKRWGLACIGVALLASTHPWTGAQVLAIVGVWCAVQLLLRLRRHPLDAGAPAWFFAAMAFIFLGFVGYNLVYLNQFEEHRRLSHFWSLRWILNSPMLVMAYAPLAVLAFWRLLRDKENRWTHNTLFLCIAALVSFGLANHHWFTVSRQPVHFTRGYIWLPLCLLALPLLQQAWQVLLRLPRSSLVLGVVLLAFLATFDNAAMLSKYAANASRYGLYLKKDDYQVLQEISRRDLRGVLLATSSNLMLLTPTYTHLEPYVGHWANTPDYSMRFDQFRRWMFGKKIGPWLRTIDYMLLPSRFTPAQRKFILREEAPHFHLLFSVGRWHFYQRKPKQ